MFYLLTVTIALFIFGNPAFADIQPKRIVVVPFKIIAPENMAYLKDGIADMLTSRISWENKVSVVGREETLKALADMNTPFSETTALEIGRKLRADYVLFGSLTVSDNSVSIDAKTIDVTGTRSPLTFFYQSKGMDEVVPQINRFAEEINNTLFERVSVTQKSPAPLQQPDIYRHPEKLLQDGALVETKEGEGDDRWRSRPFKTHLKGLSVGDIDGDGANETVFIDQNRIYAYRFENNRLVKIAEFQKSRFSHFLTVDVADINGNGKAEIFITNYAKLSERPISFVIEYAESDFALLTQNAGWYYRVISESANRPILLAQEHEEDSRFSKRIHVLAFENGRYVSVDKVTPPKDLTIYEMTFASNVRDRSRMYIAYGRNHEIAALSAGGESVWNSGKYFDGSLNYFEYTDRQNKEKSRHYIPQRILFADTAGNVNYEVIAARNVDASLGLLPKIKTFKNGYISFMEWDDTYTLRSKWRTAEIRGYISDLAVADATNDGKADLVFTVVSNAATYYKNPTSYLVIQQLP